MPITRSTVDLTKFNPAAKLPFELRLKDFEIAVQDIYDFFFDVNSALVSRGLKRFDDLLRPAIMSGILSDLLTASLARHSRALTENRYFNGHPDLVVEGRYSGDSVKAGLEGVEVKATRKAGGAVDTHGARGFGFSNATRGAIEEIVRWSLRNAVGELVTVTTPAIERLLIHMGLDLHRYGPPCRVDNGTAVALRISISATTVGAVLGNYQRTA